MIGWHPKPFIFVHVPKCAGTSIEKALAPIVSQHKKFEELSEEERFQFWLPGKDGLQHAKLQRFERNFNVNEYFKFAFVRNPWDRAISQINYLKTNTGPAVFTGKTLKENLKIYCSTKKSIWSQDLGICQVDYLTDYCGDIRMDFIGRFESLEVDFKKICGKIGIRPVPALPHVFNSNRVRHYSEFYDEESASWIAERFARDIKSFGYRFERPGKKTLTGARVRALPRKKINK